MITIALSKGRIFKETLPLLAAADIVPVDDPETSRKLILDTNHEDIKLLIIRAATAWQHEYQRTISSEFARQYCPAVDS